MKYSQVKNKKYGDLRQAALLALTLSLVLPATVFGQAAAAKPDEKKKEEAVIMEKYVVDTTQDRGYSSKNTLSSAGRISTRLLDTPQVIQILNQELIQDLNADQMLAAVQTVAGGIVRRSFNPGDDQYIWGFRSGSSLKDGIALGSNATGPMYDVDRVEVLKGPIAMTFGNSANVGGAINYVTRKPAKRASTEIMGTVGSFSYYRGEVHLSRPATDTFRYRVDLGATDSKYSDRRYSYYKDTFIGFGTVYDISPTTSWIVDAAYSTIDYNRALTFIDLTTFKVFDAPRSFSIDTKDSKYPTKNFRATTALNSRLGEGLNMSLFFGYINFNNDWYRPFGTEYNPTTGILKRASENFLSRNHSVVTNVDFSKDWATGPLRHTIVWGAANTFSQNTARNASFAISDLNVRNPGDGGTVSNVPRTGPSPYNDYTGGRSRTSSAYVQDTISILNDRAYVVAGYRYNDFINENIYANASPAAFNKAVKRYGAVYKPTKDIALHYNHSEAFIFNTGLDFRQVPLVPSVGNQNEIGVKAELFNGQLVVSATYFDIELTNVRLLFVQGPNDPLPGNQGIYQGGTHNNKGYELTAALSQPLADGEVNLVATLFGANVLNELKVKPVGATNNTGSVVAKYRFTKGPLRNFAFGAGGNYVGERLASKIPQVPNSRFTQLPAYTAYTAFASYTRDRFRYAVNIDNVADEIFIQGAELPYWIFTDPGRMIKFSVGYKY